MFQVYNDLKFGESLSSFCAVRPHDLRSVEVDLEDCSRAAFVAGDMFSEHSGFAGLASDQRVHSRTRFRRAMPW